MVAVTVPLVAIAIVGKVAVVLIILSARTSGWLALARGLGLPALVPVVVIVARSIGLTRSWSLSSVLVAATLARAYWGYLISRGDVVTAGCTPTCRGSWQPLVLPLARTRV